MQKTTEQFDGAIFKKERLHKGWTIGKFTAALRAQFPKVSTTLIWRWERGTQPRADYFMAICSLLERKPDFFMK